MHTLTFEAVSYKKQIKKQELLTKLRMIKLVKGGFTRIEVARKFRCHRNTVGNIIREFERKIEKEDKQKLLHSSLSLKEANNLLSPLKNKKRAPLSHSRSASEPQEGVIEEIFNEKKVRVGPWRMKGILERKYGEKVPGRDELNPFQKSLAKLTLGQLKGIYKRKSLETKKKRSRSGKNVPLYDYKALAAFEAVHYDTKEITDKDSLPPSIYDKFKLKEELPVYEYNVLDAKSRFRFLAYSNHLYSEFGLKFLLFVIQFVRAKTSNWGTHIKVGADDGAEFCLGSNKKEKRWNDILRPLNASFYSYDGKRDVRKNLIERSHRTDDYEFFVPRGEFIEDKQSFLREASSYSLYFNAQRTHTGRGMEKRTPLGVLCDSKVFGAEKLLEFPVMIIEDNIELLREHTDWLLFLHEVENVLGEGQSPKEIDPKEMFDLKNQFEFFNGFWANEDAQNVLTYYQNPPNGEF